MDAVESFRERLVRRGDGGERAARLWDKARESARLFVGDLAEVEREREAVRLVEYARGVDVDGAVGLLVMVPWLDTGHGEFEADCQWFASFGLGCCPEDEFIRARWMRDE